jgi:F-type H+-transporting ATPase subunit b
MLIDWFTVIAQIVNFLILILLLKRFLYKPILRAIDKREKRIADELAQAEKVKQNAEKMGEEYRRKNEDFDRQKVEQTLKMKDEIEQERQRLIENAKQKAETIQARQKAVMQREAREFEQSFRQKMAETVVSASGKALKDLAGEDLE